MASIPLQAANELTEGMVEIGGFLPQAKTRDASLAQESLTRGKAHWYEADPKTVYFDGVAPSSANHITFSGEGADARARLIAAAPLLLKQLQAVYEYAGVVNPDTGDLHCLLCGTVTDPQDAMNGDIYHGAVCPIPDVQDAILQAVQA